MGTTATETTTGVAPAATQNRWMRSEPRWKEVIRPYTKEKVERLRGTVKIEYTLARLGAERLWKLFQEEDYVPALGALTGNQAVQQVNAGLKAIYLSGWQVAADANLAGQMYPDQSLYPANSVPAVVKRINQALLRADQICHLEAKHHIHWLAPIVADAEAGFGGPLNVFELVKAMIEAGAAGVHLEDQLASEKKCGHMGGKVLIPTQHAIKHLIVARLAADICDVPTVLLARTDANAANLLTSDVDERDKPFLTGGRTVEGFYRVHAGIEQAIARAVSYASYADLLWCETSEPNLSEAKRFAEGVHRDHPRRSILLRAHAVQPVITGNEVPTWIAHNRHAQLTNYATHVCAESVGVRKLRARLIDTRVDRATEVFQE
jgi:isocitrate lyase